MKSERFWKMLAISIVLLTVASVVGTVNMTMNYANTMEDKVLDSDGILCGVLAAEEYEIVPTYEHPKMGTEVAMNIPPPGVAPPAEPILLDVYLTENKTEYIEELRNYTIDILYIKGNRVVIEAYTSELMEIADLPFVTYIDTPLQYQLFDKVKSEGLNCIDVKKLHDLGITGKGVKVAILDLGFLGYKELLGDELPAHVTVNSTREDGDITGSGLHDDARHGTACAEIVHDVAPDAELYLVNFLYDYQWEKAVKYLIKEEVDIISFSAGSLEGLFDGTGEACGVIDNAVFDHGILWANAAGNYAQKHWEGCFSEIQGSDYPTCTVIEVGEVPTFNAFYANQNDTIILTLCWNDSWDYSTQAYQLWVFNPDSKSAWRSQEPQAGLKDHHPCDRLGFYAPATGYYYIGIKEVDATKPVHFELYSGYHDLGCKEENSSLCIEATAFGSITAGAVNCSDCSTLEPYSSRGPTNDGRIKPDFVGLDRVSTASYGDYAFPGTSAAAPHVAGAFALHLSCNNESDNQSGYVLIQPLLDHFENTTQKNNQYGYGLPNFGG